MNTRVCIQRDHHAPEYDTQGCTRDGGNWGLSMEHTSTDFILKLSGAMSPQYRPPAAAPAGTAASTSSSSSRVSLTPAAATFCSRYLTLFVPGMGTTSSPWASSQASASCPGVTPLRPATPLSASASARFLAKFSPWKRGCAAARKSPSGISAVLEKRPARMPRPRGL